MKKSNKIKSFIQFNENLKSDVSDNDDLDLPMELEYKLRTIDDDSKLTVDDFLEECGIDLDIMTDFGWASILKQKKERFDGMDDDEFFSLYYKSK